MVRVTPKHFLVDGDLPCTIPALALDLHQAHVQEEIVREVLEGPSYDGGRRVEVAALLVDGRQSERATELFRLHLAELAREVLGLVEIAAFEADLIELGRGVGIEGPAFRTAQHAIDQGDEVGRVRDPA